MPQKLELKAPTLIAPIEVFINNKINEFHYIIIPLKVKRMSRGNIFKLSGNMALGSTNSQYANNDINQIKNSLRLLKQKKNQRQSIQDQYNRNFGSTSNSQNTKNNIGSSHDSGYKNLPSSQKDSRSEYSNKNYRNEQSQNIRSNTNYDYSTKPPSYPQQNNPRNSKNSQSVHQPQNYENYPTKGGASKGANYQNNKGQSSKPQQRAQQRNQEQYYNQRQQKSIKEVNRQNQIDIVQYDPSQLRPCRVCGRKFNPDSIKKHESNCKQVFQKKRKQYNAQEHRIVDNQQKKLMKKGQIIQKQLQAQQKNQKIPKWKAQSLAFRVAMKQNKNQDLNPQQAAMVRQAQEETGIKCPHCGRKFNDTAGPRHVKFCQEQSKKNSMKKKK